MLPSVTSLVPDVDLPHPISIIMLKTIKNKYICFFRFITHSSCFYIFGFGLRFFLFHPPYLISPFSESVLLQIRKYILFLYIFSLKHIVFFFLILYNTTKQLEFSEFAKVHIYKFCSPVICFSSSIFLIFP